MEWSLVHSCTTDAVVCIYGPAPIAAAGGVGAGAASLTCLCSHSIPATTFIQ